MKQIDLTRHLLATAAYRFQKAIRNAPKQFGEFQASETTRSPSEIVRHMTHLLVHIHKCFEDIEAEAPSPLKWDDEIERFHNTLHTIDGDLQRNNRINENLLLKLVQGPISDIMTHIGQLTMLRGIIGSPIQAERFTTAEIKIGSVGTNQSNNLNLYKEEESTPNKSL